MARIGVTYDDVSDAAARLLLNGKTPTVAQVRQYLGTGSNTTISKHLRKWRSSTHSRTRSILPNSVPETLIPTFETLWNIALSEAESNFQEKAAEWNVAQQALQSMTDDFEDELNLALKANESLKEEITRLRAEKQQLIESFEELKSDYRKYKISATRTIKRLSGEKKV